MKDNYRVTEGVKKLEENNEQVLKMPKDEIKDNLEMLREILSSESDAKEFFESMDEGLRDDGISQEDVDEHIFRSVHPELFLDLRKQIKKS